MQDVVFNIDEENDLTPVEPTIFQPPSVHVALGSNETSPKTHLGSPTSFHNDSDNSNTLGLERARFSTPIHARSQQNLSQLKELQNYLKPKNQQFFHNNSV